MTKINPLSFEEWKQQLGLENDVVNKEFHKFSDPTLVEIWIKLNDSVLDLFGSIIDAKYDKHFAFVDNLQDAIEGELNKRNSHLELVESMPMPMCVLVDYIY